MQQMDEVEANIVDPDAISYMEIPTPELEKCVNMARYCSGQPWTSYAVLSQPTDDGFIYQRQIFDSWGGQPTTLKHFL